MRDRSDQLALAVVLAGLDHESEWSSADEHFVDEDTDAPDVDLLVVCLVLDHLRGEVLRSPADLVA